MNIRKLLAFRKDFKCYNTLFKNDTILKLVDANPHEIIKVEDALNENNISYVVERYFKDRYIHTVFKIDTK